MGVFDDYMDQVKSYDAGKPRTSVKPKPNTKFQSAESGGMSMPAPNAPVTSPISSGRVDTSALRGKMSDMAAEDAGFRSAAAQPATLSSSASDLFGRIKTKLFDEPDRAIVAANTDRMMDAKKRDILQTKRPGFDLSPKEQISREAARASWNPNTAITPTSPVITRESRAAEASKVGVDRFDPTKLTLGNTADGKVGMFKGGQMLDTGAAQKELGINKAPGSFIGKINTDNLGGTIDFTKQFAQDDKIFKTRMQNAQNDPQFFTGPGEPGPGTYGPNSESSQFRARRDLLSSQVDDFNRKNPITAGMSVGDIVSNTLATSQARSEIKHIDEQIFGRTQLSNKIMEALIGKDTTLQAQGMKNSGDLATQQLENIGIMDARRLMEGAETQRNRENIVAGRYVGKGNEDLEKKKTKLDLLKSLGIEGYKGKIAAGDYDGASKFATDFMNQHFGNDDELNEIFK